jgi:hypothetical protein
MSDVEKNERSAELAVETVRDAIADTMHSAACTIAGKLRSADAMDPDSGAVDWGLQTSRWLDRWSDELRQWDVRESEARLQAAITAHPGRALLLAGAAGLLLARVMRRR